MKIDVILGLQWGDEGKGKIVDYLADKYDIVARFQGGPNAGHTLKFGGNKYVLHTVPSGIFRENLINIIGNGVVIDPITLVRELDNLDAVHVNYKDRLLVAKKAHLILPTHRLLDAASEASKGKERIGSTLKGIGPTYMDKTGRNGLRVGDILEKNFLEKYNALVQKHLDLARLYPAVDFNVKEEEEKWFAAIERIKQLRTINAEYYINAALKEGKRILAEGAQGAMLDVDFGTYPFVTSSNTMSAGVCTGLGVPPQCIGEVIGITKAYATRVGSGSFPTELFDETGEKLRSIGAEYGSTTGRSRRCGWIDLPQLLYTTMLSGCTQLCITKIDVLNTFDELKIATKYHYAGKTTEEVPFDMNTAEVEPVYHQLSGWNASLDEVKNFGELPIEATRFLKIIEKYLNIPITMVSTGAEREKLLLK